MQALPLLLFTLVCLCFVGIGFGSVRREFFLGERRAGTAVIASSLLATCLGASTTLGVVSLAYRNGWSAFWWLGSGCVGLCFLGFLWAGRMRERVSVTTLPQWAETGYGLPARILAALLIVVMWAAVIASQWAAAGAVLASAFGCPIGCGICLAAVVVCTYTAWGGQASVLKTDALQVVLVGIAVGLPVLFLARLGVAPGRLAPTPRLLMTSGGMTFGRWLSMLVVVGGMYVVGPDLCSRVLAARTAATARRGAFVAAAVLLVCALLLTLTGVALRESGVELEEPRDALPYLVNRAGILPAWASSLVSIGLLAALFSSADTCLLTAASVLELDLVKRGGDRGEAERRARWFVGVVGALSVGLAWFVPDVLRNLKLAYAFYCGGLLAPLLFLGWPAGARALRREWVWAGMVAGGGLPVVLLATGRAADVVIAGALGSLCCFCFMLVGAVVPSCREADKAVTAEEPVSQEGGRQ